jgi:hypothetical protein
MYLMEKHDCIGAVFVTNFLNVLCIPNRALACCLHPIINKQAYNFSRLY